MTREQALGRAIDDIYQRHERQAATEAAPYKRMLAQLGDINAHVVVKQKGQRFIVKSLALDPICTLAYREASRLNGGEEARAWFDEIAKARGWAVTWEPLGS